MKYSRTIEKHKIEILREGKTQAVLEKHEFENQDESITETKMASVISKNSFAGNEMIVFH